MTLLYICQQFTLYIGATLFFLGTLGNSINIYIFAATPSYRTTPTTFYFLVCSISNLIYVLLNLIPFILKTVYGINGSATNTVGCKITYFLISCLNVSSVTFSYLSTIDQYFITSKYPFLRRCSTIQRTYRIVLIVIIFWTLHSSLAFIYYDISPITRACIINNPDFAFYVSIYIFVFFCVGPILIMVLFGFLTYRNISQTIALAEQQADRQLVKMILIQILLVIISMTPYGSFIAYNFATMRTVKDLNRQINEYSVSVLTILISYLYYCGNFYVFFISSSRFRRTVRDRLLSCLRRNQVQQ